MFKQFFKLILLLELLVACKGQTTTQALAANFDDSSVAAPDPAIESSNLPEPVQFTSGETFYWQLNGQVKESVNVDVYDIDLADNHDSGLIDRLKNRQIKVICYFSAGTYENWRSDADQFPQMALGKPLDEWPGERWLDIRNQKVRDIIKNRMELAVKSHCDSIEPDNLDAYQNDSGFNLSPNDQIEFLHWLAETAHDLQITIGLKNALDLIDDGDLATHFDWALSEQCYQYNECAGLKKFSQKGKAVFIAEYQKYNQNSCKDAKLNDFSLAYFNLELDGMRFEPCL